MDIEQNRYQLCAAKNTAKNAEKSRLEKRTSKMTSKANENIYKDALD